MGEIEILPNLVAQKLQREEDKEATAKLLARAVVIAVGWHRHYFCDSFSVSFPPLSTFLIEGVLESNKNYIAKVDESIKAKNKNFLKRNKQWSVLFC